MQADCHAKQNKAGMINDKRNMANSAAEENACWAQNRPVMYVKLQQLVANLLTRPTLTPTAIAMAQPKIGRAHV